MSGPALDAISRPVLTVLFDSMLRGSVVLLIAGGAAALLRHRSAAVRYRLWLLAIIATVLMPLLVVLPGWHLLPARPAVVTVPVDYPAESAAPYREPVYTADASRAATSVSPAVRPNSVEKSSAPGTPLLPKLMDVLLEVWALGAVAMGGRLLLSRASLAKLARNARSVSPEVKALLESASSQLHFSRRVRVLQSTQPAVMPMTWGLFRPTILLPQSFDEWSPSRQRVVVLHELSHTKHFDYLWILLAEGVAGIFWFNPIWRWAVNQFRDEAERSCDEIVVYAGEDRYTYASELVATVRGYARNRRATALALAMSRCSTLESRLQLILNPAAAN